MTTTATFADQYATHYAAAVRVARNQGRTNDAEDCADESAANILDRLNRGHSIDDFRAYWMTAVRNECIRRGKADRREWLTDDVRVFEVPAPPLVTFAEQTHRSPNAIAALLYRARKQLRDNYAELTEETR